MRVELILGPPGTGKTSALIEVVERELAAGTRPNRIAYVTFTRRAATEAIDRAVDRFGLAREELPWFRTLHSLCYHWLGLRRDSVMDWRKIRDFGEWIGIEVSGKYSEDGLLTGYTPGDRMLHMEHLSRVTCSSLRDLYNASDDDLPWADLERVSRGLETYKRANRILDYTDMLSEFANGPGSPELDVLVVDEAQDLSALQHRVVAKLMQGCRRVIMAADDDQAIYQWAGADVKAILSLDADTRVLDRSYRVPRQVQGVANKIIGHVGKRLPKVWAPREEEGSVKRVDDFTGADVDTGQTLVLARNTYVLVEHVIPELRRRGIYFSHNGKGAVAEEVLRDIASWERLRRGESLAVSEVLGLYTRMSSGRGYERGDRLLPRLPDRDQQVGMGDLVRDGGLLTQAIWHEALDRIPAGEREFVLAARRRGERVMGGTPRVIVSTIHGSKGGEADHVVLLKDMARRTYQEMERDEDAELRVWYVGATRARERLTIVDSQSDMECRWV